MEDLLYKALTAAGEGGAITERDLNPILTEAALQRMPLLRFMNIRRVKGNPYKFYRRDAFPAAHPEGPGAAALQTNSNYTAVEKNLKIIRSWGGVEDFVQATVDDGRDPTTMEMIGHLHACVYELVGTAYWGDALANTYQFDGFDADTGIFRLDGGANALALKDMDDLIDGCMVPGTEDHPRLLVMSQQMISQLGRLERSYTGGNAQVTPPTVIAFPGIAGGVRMRTYRDIPIYPAGLTRPRAEAASISIAQGTAGTLADATYYVKVAPVTRFGEQGYASGSVVITGGSNLASINITVAAFTHANSQYPYSDALYWKLYVSTVSGSEILVKTQNAITYSSGSPASAATTLNYAGTATARGGASGTATSGAEDQAPRYSATTPDEAIFLLDVEPDDGSELVATAYNSPTGPGGQPLDEYDLFTLKRLGDTKDQVDFLVRCYACLGVKRGAAHGVLRRVRVA